LSRLIRVSFTDKTSKMVGQYFRKRYVQEKQKGITS
jgi:hypothetical protein